MPELQVPQSSTHPVFETMQHGGAGSGKATVWIGWLFGVVVTILIFSIIGLGVARNGSFRGLGWPLAFVLCGLAGHALLVTL